MPSGLVGTGQKSEEDWLKSFLESFLLSLRRDSVMEFEVLEPYSFHSAKVIELLLLCLPSSVKWCTTGIGLIQETFLRNLWTHF